ncbi:hypothetical protein NV379_10710 [Paenibacillus sp. N1-5-1-14]|uniref:hypothetical protein n=1 Tax=Paenibacillus radicibacter TaxID=2972488 RepID=UPI002158BF5F|nr:hypothetical protein [Paenibacillus radicibacter]MCR8643130.1 hypothetical protein [Paenibacillus radicibacter]
MDIRKIVVITAKGIYIVLGVILALPMMFLISGFLKPPTQLEQIIGISIAIVYVVGFSLLFFVKFSWKITVLLFVIMLALMTSIYIGGYFIDKNREEIHISDR